MTGWLARRPSRMLLIAAWINVAVPVLLTVTLAWQWTMLANVALALGALGLWAWIRGIEKDRERRRSDFAPSDEAPKPEQG